MDSNFAVHAFLMDTSKAFVIYHHKRSANFDQLILPKNQRVPMNEQHIMK